MSKLQDRAKSLNFDEIDEPEAVSVSPGKPRTGVGVLTAAFGQTTIALRIRRRRAIGTSFIK